jgi:hypothetical protein
MNGILERMAGGGSLTMTDLITRWNAAAAVWRWSFLVALAVSALVVLQDLLYSGLPSDVPWNIAMAQYTLPWLTWALLAPAMLYLFARYPIDLHRPHAGIAAYAGLGILVVGCKLLLSAPLAAAFIWRPLNVEWADGVRWLLAHRADSNLLIFWLLVSAYTAWRYFHAHAPAPAAAPQGQAALDRLPVPSRDGVALIPVDQVDYIEADGNQVILHTASGRHPLRASLSQVEAALPAHSFLRVHRSHIVNVRRINEIQPWGRGDYVLLLANGARLLSGKTYRDAIRRLIDVRER